MYLKYTATGTFFCAELPGQPQDQCHSAGEGEAGGLAQAAPRPRGARGGRSYRGTQGEKLRTQHYNCLENSAYFMYK